MNSSPKSIRLHIGIFGRTNVGKSSFLNMLAGQDVSIVSMLPGTTTDVVEKAMELLPIGPVLLLDTGGLDDETALGAERIRRAGKAMARADVSVLLTEANIWGTREEQVAREAQQRNSPLIIVVNKNDLRAPAADFLALLRGRSRHVMCCSAADPSLRETAVREFKRLLLAAVPEDFLRPPRIVGDLLPPGGLAVLVTPIDKEAPKGRLILPQAQTLRDALDADAACMVVKENGLAAALARLDAPPALVVCDSQVVAETAAIVPPGVRCTTFSILFARCKGDLTALAAGATAIDRLAPGDRVLIAEACSHHAIEDDIGRVKLPRWLREYAACDLIVDHCSGRDYPENLKDYSVIIHCGACMLTRREMLLRLDQAREAGVPVTNYGVCISLARGVLERVLAPFPDALAAYRAARAANQRGVHDGASLANA